jgi:nucleotide-binding universal stress UspA family protein
MDDMTRRRSIVVGYDASDAGHHALQWALTEGKLRGLPVDVVHVVERHSAWAAAYGDSLYEKRRSALGAEVDQAIAIAGGGDAQVEVLVGSAEEKLCELSQDAELMVVGARGSGGFHGLLVGSVGLSVALHAACPVVVVRQRSPLRSQHMPIVLGVDNSQDAQAAIRFAFDEAAIRGCPLTAVRAWSHPHGERDPDELETAERRQVRELLQPACDEHRSVEVSEHLVLGSASKALVEASRLAQLVVVGSRGMGGLRGLLLSSVSLQVLHHAGCPVAVVR